MADKICKHCGESIEYDDKADITHPWWHRLGATDHLAEPVLDFGDIPEDQSPEEIAEQVEKVYQESTNSPHKLRETTFGQYYCDTCNSPYCEEA